MSHPNATDGSRVEALERLAQEAQATHLASEARVLTERIRDGLFYVACLGQFKRGKSTLLNALVGERILPVGVVPVTAVITVVRHGQRKAARVRFRGGGWEEIALEDLAAYVSEDQNPENRQEVAAVEVFLPSDLLASGMCLVDTPGIGSVFAGNTEVTRAFVPHVDAALVVLGADPPISADEMALIQEVARQCRDVFFVLNKADRFQDGDLLEAKAFTRRVLTDRAGLDQPRLFVVSAAAQLSGRGGFPDWDGLVGALETLAKRSGSDLVRTAEDRGIGLLARRLKNLLEEQHGALLRPVEDSERRIESLRSFMAQAETALNDLDFLFAAEHNRLTRAFASLKERFLAERVPAAREDLAKACEALSHRRGPALRRACIAEARAIATRTLDAWLAEAEPEAERLYTQAMERFIQASNDFLVRMKASGDPALAGLPSEMPPEVGFRWDSRLFYKDLFHATGQGPVTWVTDWFRTRRSALRVMTGRAAHYLVQLLEVNATRIENDLHERVLESRRRLAFEIRNLLVELVDSATGSLQRARNLHARGQEAVESEVARTRALLERLAALDSGSGETS